jgi:hypothetical protein
MTVIKCLDSGYFEEEIWQLGVLRMGPSLTGLSM